MYFNKMPVLSLEISLEKNYGKSLGLASRKSAIGLSFAVDASFRALALNPGDAADNHLFFH